MTGNYQAVYSGNHWADWRFSGKSSEQESILLSGEALAILLEISKAAISFTGEEPVSFDLGAADELLNFFGEGETRISLRSAPDTDITETLFPGIWRVKQPEGAITLDVGPVPRCVYSALSDQRETARSPSLKNEGALDPMALATIADVIAELEIWNGGGEPQGISLSHIPYPPQAQKQILEWLEPGVVSFESTGFFGAETALSRFYPIWYSCFKDRKNSIRSATIDFTLLPVTMAAPPEDIVESGRRLRDSHEILFKQHETGE